MQAVIQKMPIRIHYEYKTLLKVLTHPYIILWSIDIREMGNL